MPEGEALLQRLSALHEQQLRVVGPGMVTALQAIVDSRDDAGGTTTESARRATAESARRATAQSAS